MDINYEMLMPENWILEFEGVDEEEQDLIDAWVLQKDPFFFGKIVWLYSRYIEEFTEIVKDQFDITQEDLVNAKDFASDGAISALAYMSLDAAQNVKHVINMGVYEGLNSYRDSITKVGLKRE